MFHMDTSMFGAFRPRGGADGAAGWGESAEEHQRRQRQRREHQNRSGLPPTLDFVTVVQFRPCWELHAFLRFYGVPYAVVNSAFLSSRGESLPVVVDGNFVVSAARVDAIEHVKRRCGIALAGVGSGTGIGTAGAATGTAGGPGALDVESRTETLALRDWLRAELGFALAFCRYSDEVNFKKVVRKEVWTASAWGLGHWQSVWERDGVLADASFTERAKNHTLFSVLELARSTYSRLEVILRETRGGSENDDARTDRGGNTTGAAGGQSGGEEEYKGSTNANEAQSEAVGGPFLFGDVPTSADAALFGHLVEALADQHLRPVVLACTELMRFFTHVWTTYFDPSAMPTETLSRMAAEIFKDTTTTTVKPATNSLFPSFFLGGTSSNSEQQQEQQQQQLAGSGQSIASSISSLSDSRANAYSPWEASAAASTGLELQTAMAGDELLPAIVESWRDANRVNNANSFVMDSNLEGILKVSADAARVRDPSLIQFAVQLPSYTDGGQDAHASPYADVTPTTGFAWDRRGQTSRQSARGDSAQSAGTGDQESKGDSSNDEHNNNTRSDTSSGSGDNGDVIGRVARWAGMDRSTFIGNVVWVGVSGIVVFMLMTAPKRNDSGARAAKR